MRSTADGGMRFTSVKTKPPVPATGAEATRRPLTNTRVVVLRSASCEPPFVEPEPTLALLLPMLLLPVNCGTALRIMSKRFVAVPVFASSAALMIATGAAGASAAIGM
jgi:hypothetical protein